MMDADTANFTHYSIIFLEELEDDIKMLLECHNKHRVFSYYYIIIIILHSIRKINEDFEQHIPVAEMRDFGTKTKISNSSTSYEIGLYLTHKTQQKFTAVLEYRVFIHCHKSTCKFCCDYNTPILQINLCHVVVCLSGVCPLQVLTRCLCL
jgi:hypothetical protein